MDNDAYRNHSQQIFNHVYRDIVSFFRSHWPHLIIVIPAVFVFTAIHEFAHCIGVWIQGGQVTDFAWLPSGAEWGHMQFVFPPGTEYNAAVISLGPYAMWICFILLAGILSLKRTAWPFWFASTVFIWLFAAPLADIANTAVPYLLGNAQNDMQNALGPAQFSYAMVAGVFFIAAAAYGFVLNKRLYRYRCIGLPAYCALAAAAALAICIITG